MRTKRKLDTWLWFIISLLPVLFAVIYSLCITDTMENFGINVFINNLIGILPTRGIIYNTLINIMSYFTENLQFTMTRLLCSYATYIILSKFLHILVDVLTFLLILAEKLIDKMGGTKLND